MAELRYSSGARTNFFTMLSHDVAIYPFQRRIVTPATDPRDSFPSVRSARLAQSVSFVCITEHFVESSSAVADRRLRE